MATVYCSVALGRAVIQMDDGDCWLLDVAASSSPAKCPQGFIDMLQAMASDVSVSSTSEATPFAELAAGLARRWRQERVTSLVLIALDSRLSAPVRGRGAHLANELLSLPDCALACRARLSAAPLTNEADPAFDAGDKTHLAELVAFLRRRQSEISRAAETWVRAQVRISTESTWSATLREAAVRLGAFLAMSDALAQSSVEPYDAWLSEVLSLHGTSVSDDLLRLLIEWRDQALSEHNGPTNLQPVIAIQRHDGISKAELLRLIDSGALSESEILSRFSTFAPSWLESESVGQGRSIPDLVGDLLRAGPVNYAGVRELAQHQRDFPELRAVWVLARRPLDLQAEMYSVVRTRIGERHVRYYYFLPNRDDFEILRSRLVHDLGDAGFVDKQLHFITVPALAFVLNPGAGLLIPEDVTKMEGVRVTQYDESGNIKEAQSLSIRESQQLYVALRNLVESTFHEEWPRLPNEPPPLFDASLLSQPTNIN